MQYVRQELLDFTYTNLTDTYLPYNAATTYTFEAGTPTNASVVRFGTYYYRSLINGNVGNDPELTENVKWLKYGISNKYAMLDLSSQTVSKFTAGNLIVEFKQGTMGTLGIGNYSAQEIRIEQLDITGIVQSSITVGVTLNNLVTDYWTYMYTTYGYEGDKAIKITFATKADRIRVTFIKSSESPFAGCGFLVAGTPVGMGESLYGVNFKFNSYALKERDDFGTLKITKRAVQDLVDFETVIPASSLMSYKRGIKGIYNDIIMFILDERENSAYESMLVLGIIQDASVILSNPVQTIISWSIMEAI